jgi:hypothetical protein
MALIPGVHRSDVPYIWPPRLYRPSFDYKLAYLDLNHWIYLAKAATGHPDGTKHEPALAALRKAKASGKFLFVLSGTHYMEMEGIKNPRQRRDITDVMEELTGFRTLASRAVLIKLEIEAALDELVQPREEPLYPSLTLLGNGVFHAFGMRGGLRVRNEDGEDVTEKARLDWPDGPEAFDRWQADAELLLERSILRGPTDEEAPELRGHGWRPEMARRTAEERAAAEQEQSKLFATFEEGRWQRGKTRDVVAGRYLGIELAEMTAEGLAARGRALGEAFSDPALARRLTDSMPSADIAITLTTARHRNPQTRWVSNDIFDIDAMSVAVPYCDIVVTERHACHALKAAHVERQANTQLFDSLDALASLVEATLA